MSSGAGRYTLLALRGLALVLPGGQTVHLQAGQAFRTRDLTPSMQKAINHGTLRVYQEREEMFIVTNTAGFAVEVFTDRGLRTLILPRKQLELRSISASIQDAADKGYLTISNTQDASDLNRNFLKKQLDKLVGCQFTMKFIREVRYGGGLTPTFSREDLKHPVKITIWGYGILPRGETNMLDSELYFSGPGGISTSIDAVRKTKAGDSFGGNRPNYYFIRGPSTYNSGVYVEEEGDVEARAQEINYRMPAALERYRAIEWKWAQSLFEFRISADTTPWPMPTELRKQHPQKGYQGWMDLWEGREENEKEK
jgi:hypothetical protein